MMPCLYFQLTLLWGNIPTNMLKVDVPHLQPGEEGNVSVGFISPLEPGKKSSCKTFQSKVSKVKRKSVSTKKKRLNRYLIF